VVLAARRQLGSDPRSLPFVAAYTFSDKESLARLAWTIGIPEDHPAVPASIGLDEDNPVWPVHELAAGHDGVIIDALPDRFESLPTGAWDEPPVRAIALPLGRPGDGRPDGFIVIGLNRYRRLDDSYRGFLDLIASQIATAFIRGRAFEQERQRAEDLARLDFAKTTFFTNISHELRTPLTLLLGPAEDALRDDEVPLAPSQRARIEVIQRNAERLLKLVNMLLDFSRMEAGRGKARYEPLELARYTVELTTMFDSAVRRAGLSLSVDCTPLAERVYVDREMWANIVFNLLSNALKATFSGGISVRLEPFEGAAQLTVTDTGVGIPLAEQGRLFERFHRVSGAALRTHEGSGIGLALVAELAAAHGGSVGVRSAPGTGSTFAVRIPVGSAHLPPDQIVDELDDTAPDPADYGSAYLAEASRWLEPAATGALSAAGEFDDRPVVLVVDDNPDMRAYIGGLLVKNYRVVSAADGFAALELVRNAPPDLVLTDVMMPGLGGFGLLAALRADRATLHVPVIMLSARSGDDATVEGLDAGADDYLVKPSSARELLARVRANLELDRARRLVDELARSQGLLDQAEALAHVGSWELTLSDNSILGSAELFRILGAPPGQPVVGGLGQALQLVRAEDREVLALALDQTRTEGVPLDVELQLTGRPDDVRLVRAHGVLHRGSDGEPAFIRGSIQDITEQRAAERAVTVAAAAQEAAAREHAIAEELQRSLLPVAMFSVDPLVVATYYRAGIQGTQVGGDWYDVIKLAGGRTALVLGDVMGRGVRAAAVMGLLRATVRAYSRLNLPPETLLALLDEAVGEINEHTIVTCVYAIHDPNAATLTYGNAGHLPPLLRLPGSPARRLSAGGPPLGTGRGVGEVETVDFPEGAVLTLYTDGLVEHRGGDIEDEIDRLIELLNRDSVPFEALPSEFVAALLPDDPEDDVAVLVARVTGPAEQADRVTLAVPGSAESVRQARRAAARALSQWQVSEDKTWDVLLAVSELVTNAIRHATTPIELRMRRTGQLIVVDVYDSASAPPAARDASPDVPNGRGLRLLEAVAHSWGTRPTGNGKSVWCVIALAAPDSWDKN
jgi:signal transduction histidine kinase/DNA-binding response OmpR family regulator/anti-sigma regulatory factor (Ser/Thr protein kinase)